MAHTSDSLRLCELYDAGLFDLDGVLYLGNIRIKYASDTLAQARSGGFVAVFVTNNASRTPHTVAQHLTDLGISAQASDIVTSAQIGVELALSVLGDKARVLLCGAEGLYHAAEEAGLTIVDSADDNPDGVIHGFSPDMNWERLSEAVLAINNGARYIATNCDRVIPRERGLMLGVGSLAAAITHATGIEPITGAKPQPHMFHHAARKAKARKPLVIGDNCDTDIRGANASGFSSMHVLTGAHRARDIVCAQQDRRPRYLADDLRSLCESYPSITYGDSSNETHSVIASACEHIDHVELARLFGKENETVTVRVANSYSQCYGSSFEINGRRYRLDRQVCSSSVEVSLDEYRALVHALWLWLDTHPGDRKRIETCMPDVKVRHNE